MEPRISIITLGVTDFKRSLTFYKDGLGFPTDAAENDPIAFFNTAGTKFAIYPVDKLAEDINPDNPSEIVLGNAGITLAHNCRQKSEVSEILRIAEKFGGKILKNAQDVFWGGHSGYFADPDGHHWEVAWAESFKFDDDGHLILNNS